MDDFNRAFAQILQLFFDGTESHIARLYERASSRLGKNRLRVRLAPVVLRSPVLPCPL
jgi:hypothetical protein